MLKRGYKLYFYTHYSEEKHRNDIEIDFIISNNSKINYKIFPIEVKYGKKYQTKSLDRFVEKYKDRLVEAYVIHPRNLYIKDQIRTLFIWGFFFFQNVKQIIKKVSHFPSLRYDICETNYKNSFTLEVLK